VSPSLYDLTGPDVDRALRRNPMVVLPFGSVEQHGPHLPCGTDTMAAELVARELADRLDALLVPFAPYGVTPIHAGHAGTVCLSRRSFEALLIDVCEELIRMGAGILVFVNWHEGNTASLNAVATDLQKVRAARFVVAQACYVAQRLYRDRGGELTHGGGIETAAVLAHDPSLARLDRVGSGSRPAGAAAMDELRRSHEVYGFVTDVSEIAEEGWYGDPSWATPQVARTFAPDIVDEIVKRLDEIGALQEWGR
jgi:creatinine amidohydrolase